MYCIERDKYNSKDNTMCPYMAYFNQLAAQTVPCSTTCPNVALGGYYPYRNSEVNYMPLNYSGFQMNPSNNPNFYGYNGIGNNGISIMPVPIEDIED